MCLFWLLFSVLTEIVGLKEIHNHRSGLWASDNEQSGRQYNVCVIKVPQCFKVSREGVFFYLQKLLVFGLFSKERHTTNTPVSPVLVGISRNVARNEPLELFMKRCKKKQTKNTLRSQIKQIDNAF